MLNLYSIGSVLRALSFIYFGENKFAVNPDGLFVANTYQLMNDSELTLEDRKQWFEKYNQIISDLIQAIENDAFADSFKTGNRNAPELFANIGNHNADKLKKDLINLVKFCSDAFLSANGMLRYDSQTFKVEQNDTRSFGVEWRKLKGRGINLNTFNNIYISKFFNQLLSNFAYREINESELITTINNFYVEYIPQMPRFIIPLAVEPIQGGLKEIKIQQAEPVIEKPNTTGITFPHYDEKIIQETMEKNFKFTKPLVVFDLETTDKVPTKARITQIAARKYFRGEDGKIHHEDFLTYVNPQINIPEAVTALTGITNELVADKPLFGDVVQQFMQFIQGCDLAGYNSQNYDLKVLENEFIRLGQHFILDPNIIHLDVNGLFDNPLSENNFHKIKIQRQANGLPVKGTTQLTSVYRGFFGKDFENAHDAMSDVQATFDVLSVLITRALSEGTIQEVTTEILQPFATKIQLNRQQMQEPATTEISPEKYLNSVRNTPIGLLEDIKSVQSFGELINIINNWNSSQFATFKHQTVKDAIIKAIIANLINENKQSELDSLNKTDKNKLMKFVNTDKDLKGALKC